MQILSLLGMYFDAVVVEVKTNLLLFRLALAILSSLTLNLDFSLLHKRQFISCLVLNCNFINT